MERPARQRWSYPDLRTPRRSAAARQSGESAVVFPRSANTAQIWGTQAARRVAVVFPRSANTAQIWGTQAVRRVSGGLSQICEHRADLGHPGSPASRGGLSQICEHRADLGHPGERLASKNFLSRVGGAGMYLIRW